MSEWQCEFGFLLKPVDLNTKYLSLQPVDTYGATLEAMQSEADLFKDLHGPLVRTRSFVFSTGEERTRAEHTSPAWPIPSSHRLVIHNNLDEDPKLKSAGFLIYFMGFLLGSRVQFADWYVVGSIPLSSFANFYIYEEDIPTIVDSGYEVFQNLQEDNKVRLTNALYVLNRSHSAVWTWEQFSQQYMVLDTLWRISESEYGVSSLKHKDRLRTLFSYFDLKNTSESINRADEIVELRNDLFHECKWNEGMPDSVNSSDEEHLIRDFYSLLNRLVASLLLGKNELNKRVWTNEFQPGFLTLAAD